MWCSYTMVDRLSALIVDLRVYLLQLLDEVSGDALSTIKSCSWVVMPIGLFIQTQKVVLVHVYNYNLVPKFLY